MGKQRKTWTAQQKQAIVLAALRGDHSIAELARQHSIREQLIYRWKSDFLDRIGKCIFRFQKSP